MTMIITNRQIFYQRSLMSSVPSINNLWTSIQSLCILTGLSKYAKRCYQQGTGLCMGLLQIMWKFHETLTPLPTCCAGRAGGSLGSRWRRWAPWPPCRTPWSTAAGTRARSCCRQLGTCSKPVTSHNVANNIENNITKQHTEVMANK